MTPSPTSLRPAAPACGPGPGEVSLSTSAADLSRDPLTGLLDARGLHAHLRHVAPTAAPGPIGVVVLDVTDLGSVNQAYGHRTGDALLQNLTAVIRACTRGEEVVARLRDDEFVLLLPSCNRAGAEAVARRLEQALRDAGIAITIAAAFAPTLAAWPDAVADADRRRRQPTSAPRTERPLHDVPHLLRRPLQPQIASPTDRLLDILDRAREHLGLDVLFVGRWTQEMRIFEHVSAAEPLAAMLRGIATPLEESYCQAIVQGRAPTWIPDATAEPAVRDLPVTTEMGIGAHVGIALHLPDGTHYGTLCGAARSPDATVNARDAHFLEFVAEAIADDLAILHQADLRRTAVIEDIERIVEQDDLDIVVQPILDLSSGAIVAYEALARFRDDRFTTQGWFERAHDAGAGIVLELHALRKAVRLLRDLDGPSLTVNVSAVTLQTPLLLQLIDALPTEQRGRLVLEVTESNPGALDTWAAVIAAVRQRGVRIAVDDTGAGYAGMQRLLRTRPEIIKLDRDLVCGITEDPARQALARAMLDFAASIDAQLVAEGIESPEEQATLARLGVPLGQGYALGVPAPPARRAA